MTVPQAISEIESAGGFVQARGNRIRCRVPKPRPVQVAEAVEVLFRNKRETLSLLRRSRSGPDRSEIRWHPVCLASQRKFGTPSARLYPLLGHSVVTPAGQGVLKQVFSDCVRVHFKGEQQTREFYPGEIAVPADIQSLNNSRLA